MIHAFLTTNTVALPRALVVNDVSTPKNVKTIIDVITLHQMHIGSEEVYFLPFAIEKTAAGEALGRLLNELGVKVHGIGMEVTYGSFIQLKDVADFLSSAQSLLKANKTPEEAASGYGFYKQPNVPNYTPSKNEREAQILVNEGKSKDEPAVEDNPSNKDKQRLKWYKPNEQEVAETRVPNRPLFDQDKVTGD
jgi:hypothetical protein